MENHTFESEYLQSSGYGESHDFFRDHMSDTFKDFLERTHNTHFEPGSIDFDDVHSAVAQACDFLQISHPEEINPYSEDVSVLTGDLSTLDDDVLGVNFRQLQSMGATDKEMMSLVFTHEMFHRELQGAFGLDYWAEEMACDYMSGVNAGLNGMDVERYAEMLAQFEPDTDHPYGFIRASFMMKGAEFAQNFDASNPPTKEEVMSEMNYEYQKIAPAMSELRNDVIATELFTDKLYELYGADEDIEIYNPEKVTDGGAKHLMPVVNVSSDPYYNSITYPIEGITCPGTSTKITHTDIAHLQNDLCYNSAITVAHNAGDKQTEAMLSMIKADSLMCDLGRAGQQDFADFRLHLAETQPPNRPIAPIYPDEQPFGPPKDQPTGSLFDWSKVDFSELKLPELTFPHLHLLPEWVQIPEIPNCHPNALAMMIKGANDMLNLLK